MCCMYTSIRVLEHCVRLLSTVVPAPTCAGRLDRRAVAAVLLLMLRLQPLLVPGRLLPQVVLAGQQLLYKPLGARELLAKRLQKGAAPAAATTAEGSNSVRVKLLEHAGSGTECNGGGGRIAMPSPAQGTYDHLAMLQLVPLRGQGIRQVLQGSIRLNTHERTHHHAK